MYNSQYYTCEQIDQRLLQGYLDDYNSQNDTNLTKEQFLTLLFNTLDRNSTVDNIVTQIGYYECDTAGATAAKAITVANYALFAGGSIKVKFLNRNTAGSATLNINSQGAKTLYYGGKAVSASNSWDNNEIVEIYYDGTNYYANNVEGNFRDGIFDISAYNLTEGQPTKYTTLSEALGTNGANVPAIFRKGGMQIKYVSASDNKYVQCRLMSETFNTTPANWQGVDNEPTAGSDNLVKSGGVAPLRYVLYPETNKGYINKTTGEIVSHNSWRYSEFVPVTEGTVISVHGRSSSSSLLIAFYDENKQFISTSPMSEDDGTTYTTHDVTVPSGAYFLRGHSATPTSASNERGWLLFDRNLLSLTVSNYDAAKSLLNGLELQLEQTYGSTENCTIGNTASATVYYVEEIGAPVIRGLKSISFKVKKNANTLVYLVTINESDNTATTQLIKTVDNSSATDGLIKTVDLNMVLQKNQRIGITGSFYYTTTEPTGKYIARAIPVGGGNITGRSGVTVALSYTCVSIYSQNIGRPSNEVIVSPNGDGDYLNPFEAMVDLKGKDSALNPITIKVMPGTYNMPTLPVEDFFTYCTNRYLSIVGTDKVNCILRNDNGYYNASASEQGNLGDNTPLKISGNVYIANLTIISTDTENASIVDNMYHRSYCIHADATAAEGSIMEIHNCRLVNNHAPCIGFGISKNTTLKVTDCELYADFYDLTSESRSSIIIGHDRPGSSISSIEEHVFIKNCTFISPNGRAFYTINNYNALMDVVFVNNACSLPSGMSIILGEHTTIDKLSFGNSLTDMNYNS